MTKHVIKGQSEPTLTNAQVGCFVHKMHCIRCVVFLHPILNCRNPSLRLVTKARACKVASQERKPRNERKCEGMNPHTPKGASTLGLGVPVDF